MEMETPPPEISSNYQNINDEQAEKQRYLVSEIVDKGYNQQ